MDEQFKLNSRKFYQRELPPVRLCWGSLEARGSIESMNSSTAQILLKAQDGCINKADIGTLQLGIRGSTHQPAAMRVVDVDQIIRGGSKFQLVSVVFTEVQESTFDAEDAILFGAFVVPFRYQPSWYADFPFLYSYKLVGDVEAVGAYSMVLSTSLSNNVLIPGFRMRLQVDLKHLNSYTVEGYINDIIIDHELSCMHLTFIYDRPYYEFLRSASEYILCFSPSATPAQLRGAHMPVDGYDCAIKVSYADTLEEFTEVLRLRHNVSLYEERIDPDTSPDDMEDDFDQHSRQIILRVGERVAACGRVLFVEQDMQRSEISRFAQIPDKFFREGFYEVGHLNVDPEYRGGDLYMNLMNHTSRIGAENGIRYAFAAARAFLMPTYKKLGAYDTGLTAETPVYPGERLHVIYFDHRKIEKNTKGSFFAWARTFSSFVEYGLRMGYIKWSLLTAIKLPLARLAVRCMHGHRRRKWSKEWHRHRDGNKGQE
ncbi:MAG: hypothetical protein ACM3UZ_14425 [Acidobacteriota bacterium]